MTVSISWEEYTQLKYDSDMLEALKQAGVDNWDGYPIAMKIFDEWYAEEEEEEEEEE